LFALVFAEIFAFLLVAATNLIQHTSIRYISSLLSTGNFLALHARVCLCLHNWPSKTSFQTYPKLTAPTFYSSILYEFYNAQTYSTLPHLIFIKAAIPTFTEISSLLLSMFYLDIITYSLREFLPAFIETNWILFYHCLLSTIWVLSTMQLNYSMILIVFKTLGIHLPLEYRQINHIKNELRTSFFFPQACSSNVVDFTS